MNRRSFMKAAGVVCGGMALKSSVHAGNVTANKNATILNARNKSHDVASISLPDMSVTDMTDDFFHDMSSESIVEVEVLIGDKTKRLRLDASKEDFTIAFPDGTSWNSRRDFEIKEKV